MFSKRVPGKTPVSRTAGTSACGRGRAWEPGPPPPSLGTTSPSPLPPPPAAEVASDGLKGRVFTVSLADLSAENAEDVDYRKIKLVAEEVQGKAVLCNFYGMDMTRDKLNSLIRKWQTCIEASVDATTTDGYRLRLFAIAFTKRRANQIRKTSYAKASQIRAIRKKMTDIMSAAVSATDLKGIVKKFIPEALGKEIEKACAGVYPLQNVFVRKVKTIKQPRFDVSRLMEMHGDAADADVGKSMKVRRGGAGGAAGGRGRSGTHEGGSSTRVHRSSLSRPPLYPPRALQDAEVLVEALATHGGRL